MTLEVGLETEIARREDATGFLENTRHDIMGDDGNRVMIGFFGSKRRVADRAILGSAMLAVPIDQPRPCRFQVSFHATSADASGPPRNVRSLKRLFTWSRPQVRSAMAFCTTSFAYPIAEGFETSVKFPMPLQVPSNDFTHMESFILSLREQEELVYTLAVYPDDDVIRHDVTFEKRMELSRAGLTDVLRRASNVSMALVTRKGESQNEALDENA